MRNETEPKWKMLLTQYSKSDLILYSDRAINMSLNFYEYVCASFKEKECSKEIGNFPKSTVENLLHSYFLNEQEHNMNYHQTKKIQSKKQ